MREREALLHAVSRAWTVLALVGAQGLVLPGCSAVTPRHTAYARLGGHMLDDARRADALGLTPTATLLSLPITVGQFARTLSEGDPRSANPAALPVAEDSDQEWFVQLLEKHESGIEDVWDESDYHSTFVEPLHEPMFRFAYVDAPVRVYNEQGRRFNRGANFYVSNRVIARLYKKFVLSVEPELGFVENRNDPTDDSDLTLRFQELALSALLGPAEITVGRMPLWWGPGRHGSLLLSNNARPFDMLRTTTAPQLLPGFLGYLGLVQAELFVTRLERERAVSEPILAGVRVSTRLNPYMEIGACRTAQFGGEGRSVSGQTILNVITARNENDVDDPGNQLASLHARLIVPLSFQPFEVYGELGGEDEAGGFFSDVAYLAGVYLPRIGPWSWVEATFEITDTSASGERRTWYTNGNFPDGYTFRDDIIGHHVGTDGLDVYLGLVFHPQEDFRVHLSYNYEEHFRLDPTVERVHEFRLAASRTRGRRC